MEFKSRIRWILVIAVTIIALILIVWGLFTIASNIFRGNDDNQTDTVQVDADRDTVQSTAVAAYKVTGPIVANEDQRSYTIVVSANNVTMKTFGSFGKTLIAEKSYINTPIAYESFLSALANADVTALRRNASTEFTFEDQGVCARGRKFFVELDTNIFRWSTSCGNREGNAGFNMAPVSTLFQRQIPDFAELTRGLGI
jgi:hypothetical protein